MTSEALTLDQLETVNGGEVLKTQEVRTVIWNKEALQICRGNDVLRVVQNTGALQIIENAAEKVKGLIDAIFINENNKDSIATFTKTTEVA